MRIQPDNNRPLQAIQILIPLSAATPATEQEGGGVWLPIMPVGRWTASHLTYGGGIYEITPGNLAEMVSNFDRQIKPIDLSVREGHWGDPAMGWIQQLRSDSQYLYARVAWTPPGQELIDQQQFRYVSPGWFDLETPYVIAATGEKVPWVLDHVALTNDPFFTELPAAAERRPDGAVIYLPQPNIASQEPAMPDKPPADPAAPPTPDPALTAAERQRLITLEADNAELKARQAEAERVTQLAALKARFAAVKRGSDVIAPAHAEALAAAAMDLPADKREAFVTTQISALEKGFVPIGERGGVSPHGAGSDFNPNLIFAARRLGFGPEFAYAASHRGPGGSYDMESARQAIARISPLTAANVEIPSLSYQETMTLIEGMFLAGYEAAPGLTQAFANRVVSSQRTISYRALGAPPRMREWLAEIQSAVFNTPTAFPVTIRDWEATVEIPLSLFQADQLGEYAIRMQQMGGFAKQHPDELLATLIAAAETTLCYDGQYLCDTDHNEGQSGDQSNLLTTGGDSDDIADVVVDLGTALAAFQRFKDDKGKNMRIASGPNPVLDVLCRPEDYPVFFQLATADNISGTTNGWKGRIRPLAIPELTTADEWFVLWTGGPVKPFIAQYQNEPSALKTLGPGSEHCAKTGNIWVSTQGNYTVAPGDWRYVIKIQKT